MVEDGAKFVKRIERFGLGALLELPLDIVGKERVLPFFTVSLHTDTISGKGSRSV